MRNPQNTRSEWYVERVKTTQDTSEHWILGLANDDKRRVLLARVLPVSDDGQEGSESHANALLMRAAPELLAALAWAQARIFCHEGNSDVYEAARAAIAKAKGE